MPIVLDDSAWPVVHHSVGDHSVEQFNAFGDWYLDCLKRARADNVSIYVLSDARGGIPDGEVRRRAAQWLAGLSEPHFNVCALSIIVVDNPLIRGAITALNWFRRPSTPQQIVASVEEGWQLIVDDHVRRSLPIPARPSWAPASS